MAESGEFTVSTDWSEYIQQILDSFEMADSHAVATPRVSRLSSLDRGYELSNQEKSQNLVTVDSLLYLAC